jgi:TRAP transporter TAXI family solute receptor
MVIPSLSRKQLLGLLVSSVAVLGLLIWLLTRYLSPAPPKRIDITTGAVDGGYHQIALKYQAYLKANGVSLELKPSTGSLENLDRLHAGVSVGFVQGGLGILSIDPQITDEDTPLRSLGVMAYEPIWLFVGAGQDVKDLSKGLSRLAGQRIGVGPEGSGTRKVALELLASYGVTAANSQLMPTSGLTAANALLDHSLDALIVIGTPQAPAIELLLAKPEVKLISLAHAEGLSRRLPFLSIVTLKAGSIDPERDIPTEDIPLLTTTANLVVRDDLHPALAYLLLEAARSIHQGATLLNKPGEFPNASGTDFPLADEALRYYKEGRPFLQRYLPYWAANALQRLLLVLIPLLAIAIPVLKAIPALLDFKEKNRLYRRYGILQSMERDLLARQLSSDEIDQASAQLDQVERDITGMKFSLDFSDRVYTLRQHVDYVRLQLEKERNSLTKSTTSVQ